MSLPLVGADDEGDALYYDAAGLPEGLTIDPDTGVVSGTLLQGGVAAVTLSASDGPAVAVVELRWTVTPAACGDAMLDAGEACDDGNRDAGDGCSAVCTVEGPSPVCGDGHLDVEESCDDGNRVDGDGCSAACAEEPPPEEDPARPAGANCQLGPASPPAHPLWILLGAAGLLRSRSRRRAR